MVQYEKQSNNNKKKIAQNNKSASFCEDKQNTFRVSLLDRNMELIYSSASWKVSLTL